MRELAIDVLAKVAGGTDTIVVQGSKPSGPSGVTGGGTYMGGGSTPGQDVLSETDDAAPDEDQRDDSDPIDEIVVEADIPQDQDARAAYISDHLGIPIDGLAEFLRDNPEHPLNDDEYVDHVRNLQNADFNFRVALGSAILAGWRAGGLIGAVEGAVVVIGGAMITGVCVNR